MFRLPRSVVFAVCGALTIPVLPAADFARQIVFSGKETHALHESLDKRWKEMVDVSSPAAADRDLFEMLLDAAATKWHPERWERLLELAGQMQVRDLAVDRYHDIFGIQRAVFLAMFYGDRLTPSDRSALTGMCQRAAEPARSSKIELGHTNMIVAKLWDLIALGEFLGDAKLADEGYDLLNQWLVFTRTNGLFEYNSPTYSLADLGSLSLISQFAARPEGRENASAGLQLMWDEVVANWFAPGGRLGGAHSRNYHPLTSEGIISLVLGASGGEDISGAFWKAVHLPPPDVKCQVVPRFVAQKWGAGPGQYATHYVGRALSIGAAGASYSYQDTPLSLTWAGGTKLPGGYFVMDGRGDPYGIKKVPTGKSGGHEKVVHLIPELMSVQRDGEVLLLAWIDLENTKIAYQQVEQLASDLVLPVMDKLWAGEKPVTLKENDFEELPDGTSLVGRWKDTVVGVRVLYATDVEGHPAKTGIFGDGLKAGAFRLACVQSEKGAAKGKAQIALWVRMAEGMNESSIATFRKDFAAVVAKVEKDGDALTVTADGLEGKMKLSANLGSNERLACEGGNPNALNSVLWVNGIDIGSRVLESAPALRAAAKTSP